MKTWTKIKMFWFFLLAFSSLFFFSLLFTGNDVGWPIFTFSLLITISLTMWLVSSQLEVEDMSNQEKKIDCLWWKEQECPIRKEISVTIEILSQKYCRVCPHRVRKED